MDQDAAYAHLVAHFSERDFLGSRCEHYFDFALSPTSGEWPYENGPGPYSWSPWHRSAFSGSFSKPRMDA
jgi:hypothetical protein